jgi:hypothetical protein
VKLPFKVHVEYASPLLGESTSIYEKVETNVDVAADVFQIAEKK